MNPIRGLSLNAMNERRHLELEFKRDFAQAQANWEAFWRGENTRPLISAIVPKPGVEPVPKPPYTSGRDGNFAPVIAQVLQYMETHEFVGEAIPFYQIEFAADHFAGLLGAELRFREDEHGYGWAVPFVQDWDDVQIAFRPDGFWWERTVAFAEALRRVADGRFLIAPPTMVANLDALSALRGPQDLLLDLVEQPDKVHRALQQVTRAWEEISDALAELLDFATYGSINRHGMYTTGRINVPQCDFSCMISPAMFREFALPHLTREFAGLDGGEYHLDGPGAIKHLEALCEIPDLDVVQWVPGDGPGQEMDWTWLYEKIDALGKGQILGGNPERVRRLWRQFRSRTLFFTMSFPDRASAEAFIAEMEGERK